jgi:hypothetical protein
MQLRSRARVAGRVGGVVGRYARARLYGIRLRPDRKRRIYVLDWRLRKQICVCACRFIRYDELFVREIVRQIQKQFSVEYEVFELNHEITNARCYEI